MADQKLTQLTALTALASDDLLLVTDDPGGTPASKSVTAAKLLHYAETATESAASVSISDYTKEPGNVVRYGATGDGATDDTTALQAALDVSYIHPMYLPKTSNFYKITSALTMPDQPNVKIYGDYGGSEIRQATASANGINSNSTGTRRGCVIENIVIGIDGATTQGGTALNLSNITDSRFTNIAVIADSGNQGFLTGFRVYTPTGGGAYRNEFINCKVRTDDNASAVGVLFGGDSNESSNSNHWRGGEIRADSGIGVNIPDNGTEFSNQNCIMYTSFEGSTATAVNLAGAENNTIAFCRFEGPTTGIALDTNCIDNLSMFNFYTTSTTPYSKTGNSVQENFFLDVSDHASLDRIMELGGGHYKVSALQDVARAAFDSEMGTASWPAFGTRVTSDTNMRLEIRVDGQMEWGGGSGASDVGLRHQTGRLEVITGNFDANNKFIIDGGTSGQSITTGSGTPEGSVTAPIGSLYTDTAGGAGTTLYVKESGSGNTGWVAK